MGGYQASAFSPQPTIGPGHDLGGKPGGQVGAGGGIGTKPGGRVPTDIMQGGGNPAWSPTSAETLLQQNANMMGGAGNHPLNPVPAWYQGADPFRGVNHPDPLIGRGRVQNRSGQTIRNMGPRNYNQVQQEPPPQTQPQNQAF